MKKSLWVMVPIVVIAAGCAARGANQQYACPGPGMMGQGPMGPGMMQGADANGDGVLSRDEFMKFHETVFDRMKNKDGVIDLKSMPGPRSGMPMGGGMMGRCGGPAAPPAR